MPKKGVFHNRKSEHHHWILHIRISLANKFLLKLTILIFWTKFAQKRKFWSETGKVNTTIEFCISNYSSYKFQLKLAILIFWTTFAQKGEFRSEKKIEYHHWILHIRISLGTIFQLKLTILIFWTKFAQKEYFHSKTEKVNITTKLYIFELVWVTNFSLNWQFLYSWPKRVLQIGNGKIALVRAPMVVTYYIKLSRTGAERHNSILMSLLLLVAETNIELRKAASISWPLLVFT